MRFICVMLDHSVATFNSMEIYAIYICLEIIAISSDCGIGLRLMCPLFKQGKLFRPIRWSSPPWDEKRAALIPLEGTSARSLNQMLTELAMLVRPSS
jgi:hypothetical protein